jgi:hypothetical protein
MIIGLYADLKEAMAAISDIGWKNSTIGNFLHLAAKFFGILGFGLAAIDIAATCTGVGIYATLYIFTMLTLISLVLVSFVTNPLVGFVIAAAMASAFSQLMRSLKDTIVCKA